MKYKVVLVAKVICNEKTEREKGVIFIPGTEKDSVFDTDSGPGLEIWRGYLSMRETQKRSPLVPDDWSKIRVPEDAKPENEIHKFREAINLFFRYLADGMRDNCLCVKSIELIG